MKNINQENDLHQQQIRHQQEDSHHHEEEEKQEPKHHEDEDHESQQLAVEPEHQEILGQETEQSVEELKQEKTESRPGPDKPIPLTAMPSSPPLSPLSPPPNKRPSPPHSPDHTSYHAHAISPSPSPLSSYQTTYSYNNHVESSPPPPVLKAPPSPPPSTTKLEGAKEGPSADGVAGSARKLRPNLSVLRRAKMENIKRRSLLVFRIFAFLFCLVSLSVMAADKNQGWALDSFHRYKEFRYCMSVNIIGFVYSGLQAYDLAYSLTTGKQVVRNQFRCLLDFSLDQILAYLLLSASSSSAFRVEDWESNWGKDKFPAMARASVALSFLAFIAFALSSLLSGYTLFTPHSW